MKKAFILLFATFFAGSFQQISAEKGDPIDCFEWADTLATFEGELLQLSYEREYWTFIHYYNDCLEHGR